MIKRVTSIKGLIDEDPYEDLPTWVKVTTAKRPRTEFSSYVPSWVLYPDAIVSLLNKNKTEELSKTMFSALYLPAAYLHGETRKNLKIPR